MKDNIFSPLQTNECLKKFNFQPRIYKENECEFMELKYDAIYSNNPKETLHIILNKINLNSIDVKMNFENYSYNKPYVDFSIYPNKEMEFGSVSIKEKEMTLTDIEKELGYKIKLVEGK